MLDALELKPFVPSRDFDLSCRFYRDLGFEERLVGDELAEFSLGSQAFLLQDFYRKDWAQNCVLHLLVSDARAWWRHIKQLELFDRYPGTRGAPPEDKPWHMCQFSLVDPCGVLWHIAHPTR
ncbi:glyoxalase [Chitinimonas prasina]|uniref:Glyoxalase n=1 Tax=Chitinimonas prasina TaxID=1434937 RepID=A0ABQ5YHP8_9NEIS|nr:glyoxalase [Chitinimonas prasina]GLR14522.1 glyoxalase [Chitinimonas prasina]